jgi:hypothetical protein
MFRRSTRARAAAGLACAAALMALAGAAHASALPNYFLTMTEGPTGLTVTSNLPTTPDYNPNVFVPDNSPATQSNTWTFGPTYGGYAEFFPEADDHGAPAYYSIAWADPGTGNFNVLTMAPSGNRGNINFVAVSDVTASGLYGFYNFGGFGTPDVDFYLTSCTAQGAYIPCPFRNDGQALTTGISSYGTPLGTLAITFVDHDGLRDVSTGVPEPAGWTLMIAGFGLAGATLRRRRGVRSLAQGA